MPQRERKEHFNNAERRNRVTQGYPASETPLTARSFQRAKEAPFARNVTHPWFREMKPPNRHRRRAPSADRQAGRQPFPTHNTKEERNEPHTFAPPLACARPPLDGDHLPPPPHDGKIKNKSPPQAAGQAHLLLGLPRKGNLGRRPSLPAPRKGGGGRERGRQRETKVSVEEGGSEGKREKSTKVSVPAANTAAPFPQPATSDPEEPTIMAAPSPHSAPSANTGPARQATQTRGAGLRRGLGGGGCGWDKQPLLAQRRLLSLR